MTHFKYLKLQLKIIMNYFQIFIIIVVLKTSWALIYQPYSNNLSYLRFSPYYSLDTCQNSNLTTISNLTLSYGYHEYTINDITFSMNFISCELVYLESDYFNIVMISYSNSSDVINRGSSFFLSRIGYVNVRVVNTFNTGNIKFNIIKKITWHNHCLDSLT